PSRSASVADIALDTTGALVALGIASLGWRRVADRATAALLWIALIGGAAFLIVNALAGVPSGALWFTAPAAGFALLARTVHARHRSRRPRRPRRSRGPRGPRGPPRPRLGYSVRRGSSVSRRPSLNRLMPSTVTRMARPGNVASPHAVEM